MKISSGAFDAFADVYDADFTHSILGRLLRPRVWDILARQFTAGQHTMELACGTGEDAIWLARRGVHVTATDGSAEMVRKAEAKAEAEGVQGSRGAEEQGSVKVEQVSLQQVGAGHFAGRRSPVAGHLFDGVFSNFGGLNTIGEWRALAGALAEIVRPGGKVILVPMGPLCPWEIVWYVGHGQPKMAFRRWARNGAPAKIGDSLIPIWYPSAGRLRSNFAPWFSHVETQSLELWLPPSYLDHFVNQWPGFFARLNQFEKATARLTGGWGDHYIIVFERKV
jgi:SAM-dependent methyltransferase